MTELPMDTPDRRRLVVIGNGMAGARTVEEILARGGGDMFDIVMFGDEPYGNYNRILLSGVLSGQTEAVDIFLNPLDWYTDNGVDLRAGVRVESIDRDTKAIVTSDGERVTYDQLIIATGSRPFVPPIAGIMDDGRPRSGVFVFRTIDDCGAIAEYAQERSRAVVIGGGLLGLEAARGLMTHGVDVHVVEAGPHLMGQQMDGTGGRILARTLREMGITVHCGAATSAVICDDEITAVEFADGSRVECQMIVVAAGIRPNAEIGAECGLEVNRAIVVNDQMLTSDPDIYAVGECVEHRGQLYGLVAPLWDQGQVLADHITGTRPEAAYTGSKLATKLKVMGVELAVMGLKEPESDEDEVLQFSEPSKGIYKTVIVRGGQLVGATLLGDVSKASLLTQAFDKGTPLPEDRLELMFDVGVAADVSVADMPDDAQICNCNGVSKGTIAMCARQGGQSLVGVMKTTRAGTGCGSCKDLVAEVVEWAAGDQLVEDPSIHYYVPGIPLAKPELVEAIMTQDLRSVSEVFDALADGVDDPGSKMGLTSLLRTIWGADELRDERDARYINDRVHANIQRDGTFSVVPGISGGVTSADQLRKIADVADKYEVPMIKITGGQRIDLLGIKKDDLPGVWKDLGMRSGHAYGKSVRTVKSCVGTDFCRFGVGDAIGLGVAWEDRYKGLEAPAKLKMATAGCPRNCSEAMVKDIGAVAIEGGRWEIFIGGAAGAHVRKGDVLCTVDSHEEVLTIVGRFMQYYRENAKWLERTYAFVPRVGLDEIRAVVVDDRDGIAGRLDAEIQRSIDDYVEPWQSEAVDPVTANQFAAPIAVVR